MPEIEINLETGEMETEIKGIAGLSFEKTANAIKKRLWRVRL